MWRQSLILRDQREAPGGAEPGTNRSTPAVRPRVCIDGWLRGVASIRVRRSSCSSCLGQNDPTGLPSLALHPVGLGVAFRREISRWMAQRPP